MVGAQLEPGITELLEEVAQLLRDLDVVRQHELAGRLAFGERRAGNDRRRAQPEDERALGGRSGGDRANDAGGARDVRGRRRAPAETRHQVEAQLEAGLYHVRAGRDQVTRRAALVDRHEDLVGARLETQVDACQAGVAEHTRAAPAVRRARVAARP